MSLIQTKPKTKCSSNPIFRIFIYTLSIAAVPLSAIALLIWMNDFLMPMIYPNIFGTKADLSRIEIFETRPLQPLAKFLCETRGGDYVQIDLYAELNGNDWSCVPGLLPIHCGSDGICAAKPVLYLYPSSPQKITVRLRYAGKIHTSYPPYDPMIDGWEVIAYPDGKIVTKDNREYSYLFWDGLDANVRYDLSTGFVVPGNETASFLQNYLMNAGLTPREYNEFIVYWLPQMEKNPYNLIHFAGKEYTDTAKLDISPPPDQMLRIFMVFKPLVEEIQITPQTIMAPISRKGFTVVEWGGIEIQ